MAKFELSFFCTLFVLSQGFIKTLFSPCESPIVHHASFTASSPSLTHKKSFLHMNVKVDIMFSVLYMRPLEPS